MSLKKSKLNAKENSAVREWRQDMRTVPATVSVGVDGAGRSCESLHRRREGCATLEDAAVYLLPV